MKVRDVMVRDPVTLNEGDHLDLADDLMALGRIRHLPVERDGVLVGVVSQRDLFRAAASSALRLRRTAQHTWLQKLIVRDVMSAPPTTTATDADVRDAVQLMLDKRFGCLPVVSPEGRLVGLLSETDCLRVLKRILDNASNRQQISELSAD